MASPIFQTSKAYSASEIDEKIYGDLKNAGYTRLNVSCKRSVDTRHELISCAILKRHGFDDSVCVIVGGHHGLPPTNKKLENMLDCDVECGFEDDVWLQAQDALVEMALGVAGISKEDAIGIKILRSVQVILSGLVILADWIASSEEMVDLPIKWQPHHPPNMYMERFNITKPHPVQSKLLDIAKAPGIFIAEAPMGEGKTEAALAAAEALAHKTGSRGIYFALPSQATSKCYANPRKRLDWQLHSPRWCYEYPFITWQGRAKR